MRRRTAIKLAATGAVLLCSFLIVQQVFFPRPLSYRGDGSFRQSSGGLFQSRQYDVTMPEFDLSEPQHAEYRFALLGNIPEACGVYLVIDERDHDLWNHSKEFDGQLQLDVLDSKGQEVVHVGGRLGDFIWWWETGGRCGLWQTGKSSFMPKTHEEYRVRISYTPDPRLAGHKGFVYLWSRGGNGK
jgi:hypothetical protein